MKKLIQPLFALAITALTFTSCMDKDTTDYTADYIAQEKAIDSLLNVQKTQISSYALSNFENPKLDTVKFTYNYYEKTTTRGIYYEILAEPTAENDAKYEYSLTTNSGYTQLVPATIKLKYTAKLLNGTEVQNDAGSNYIVGGSSSSTLANNTWIYSFFPYSLKLDGKTFTVGGFTEKGLKTGSKIRVITPSLWAYGSQSSDKIPANSILIYEFEVLDIK
ncbi:FKBP-type peptidyl-prolyl cis-trans isomerase [Sphingobacterium sp. LRF_L2]|uniref:FKBP-type peptidyl-prolyl cis-trans isomerase n=1 Tax=Sphingobacterium sp. LRF_L2 TaxID=3369421 RepID=UPI003F641487